MHLQLTPLGTTFSSVPDDIVFARAAFDRVHSLRLPAFLDAGLLATVQEHLPRAATAEMAYDRIGSETSVAFGHSTAALELAMNDPRLFDAIRALTGASSIGCFVGRVYEMHGGGHGFGWHNDDEEDRLIGLSLNLGTASFLGGTLQIADAGSKTIVNEAPNVVPGDAVIFRIGPDVVHRVTPVEGPAPKVAYSGWFCSKPSYQDLLRIQWRQMAGE